MIMIMIKNNKKEIYKEIESKKKLMKFQFDPSLSLSSSICFVFYQRKRVLLKEKNKLMDA